MLFYLLTLLAVGQTSGIPTSGIPIKKDMKKPSSGSSFENPAPPPPPSLQPPSDQANALPSGWQPYAQCQFAIGTFFSTVCTNQLTKPGVDASSFCKNIGSVPTVAFCQGEAAANAKIDPRLCERMVSELALQAAPMLTSCMPYESMRYPQEDKGIDAVLSSLRKRNEIQRNSPRVTGVEPGMDSTQGDPQQIERKTDLRRQNALNPFDLQFDEEVEPKPVEDPRVASTQIKSNKEPLLLYLWIMFWISLYICGIQVQRHRRKQQHQYEHLLESEI